MVVRFRIYFSNTYFLLIMYKILSVLETNYMISPVTKMIQVPPLFFSFYLVICSVLQYKYTLTNLIYHISFQIQFSLLGFVWMSFLLGRQFDNQLGLVLKLAAEWESFTLNGRHLSFLP